MLSTYVGHENEISIGYKERASLRAGRHIFLALFIRDGYGPWCIFSDRGIQFLSYHMTEIN